MNHSGMHIAKHTVHIEVEITIGFHFDGFRIVNLVPHTALYRSTNQFSLIMIRSIENFSVLKIRDQGTRFYINKGLVRVQDYNTLQ